METGWFGNTMWATGGGYDMNELHRQFAAGLYERQQAEEEESRQAALEAQIQQQSSTNCTDSTSAPLVLCALAAAAYSPTRLAQQQKAERAAVEPAPEGLAAVAAVLAAPDVVARRDLAVEVVAVLFPILACGTASAGSCDSLRGSARLAMATAAAVVVPVGSGAARVARVDAFATMVRAHLPEKCSRFCTESAALGAGVMSCGPKQCGQCEYCEDGGAPVEEAECKAVRTTATAAATSCPG